jgi:NCS1 family nucleobase:cation symporter-1
VKAVDLRPVPPSERTQPALDLFLIFAGANIVATTFVTGSSLVPALPVKTALVLIGVGSVLGAALVACLAPVGPRLGAPSLVAARAAFGMRGAALLALVLYVTNFAWIALNNVIAASACGRALGPPGSERAWAVGLGLLATAVVALGPRAVGLADRVAVPLMGLAGLFLVWRLLSLPARPPEAPATGAMSPWVGLDVVVGYQVSWILMFADYSRYTASARKGAAAVFLGLSLPSLWLMSTGVLLSAAVGSRDPAGLLEGARLGVAEAVLLALATITTNFVNVYLSALAWKSVFPAAADAASVWAIGIVGAALSLLSREWLVRYSDFMLLLGSVLVPAGGVLLARFLLVEEPVEAASLYDPHGPHAGLRAAGVGAWALGALAYHVAGPFGSTLPALVVAVSSYLAFTASGRRRSSRRPRPGPSPASTS